MEGRLRPVLEPLDGEQQPATTARDYTEAQRAASIRRTEAFRRAWVCETGPVSWKVM